MKKRNEWVRKALKRKKKEKDRGIVDFMKIVHHFFKELPQWINAMDDPRNPSYTIYTQADQEILLLILLKYKLYGVALYFSSWFLGY